MKKVASLLLAITILCTFSLPAMAEGPVFSIKLVGTVDTAIKFDGRNTYVFDWQFCANEQDVSLTNAQGLRIAYDNSVLQLIRWNAGQAIADSSLGATEFVVASQTANAGVFPYSPVVFAAKNSTGGIGYLSMTLGSAYDIYECTPGLYESLMRVRFVFREGKSEADLGSGSFRLMTVSELDSFAQDTAMRINACTGEDLNTLVSHVFRLQEGGVQIGVDTMNYPIIDIGIPTEIVSAPTANPPAGSVSPGSTVTLSCATIGATIRYTTNGSEPTTGSQEYSAPIPINADTTIKAKAFMDGKTDSDTATFVYTVSSTDALTFKVGSARARLGEHIEVPIVVTYNPGFSSVRLNITLGAGLAWDYDPLNYTNNQSTWPFIGSSEVLAIATARPTGANITDSFVSLMFPSTMENTYDNGLLVTLKLKVNETAEPGDIPIIVVVSQCFDENDKDVPCSVSPGNVTVYTFIYGDANGDGVVDDRDYQRLLQHLNGWIVEIHPGADANGDGVVDDRDYQRLLQYLNGWNVVLGS